MLIPIHQGPPAILPPCDCFWFGSPPEKLRKCRLGFSNAVFRGSSSHVFAHPTQKTSLSSWWFQPIWKKLVKFHHFPKIGIKWNKNIWHHPDYRLSTTIELKAKVCITCSVPVAWQKPHWHPWVVAWCHPEPPCLTWTSGCFDGASGLVDSPTLKENEDWEHAKS